MSDISESQQYSPQVEDSNQKLQTDNICKRRVDKITQSTTQGKWTQEQNLKYILFMDIHSKIFSSKQKRKTSRIFKSLSSYLKTRTPRQCRSHFQKIMNKFKKLKRVKEYYIELLGATTYEQSFSKISKQLNLKVTKSEDETYSHMKIFNSIQIQTDPLQIQIKDIPAADLVRLMKILNQYQLSQTKTQQHQMKNVYRKQ